MNSHKVEIQQTSYYCDSIFYFMFKLYLKIFYYHYQNDCHLYLFRDTMFYIHRESYSECQRGELRMNGDDCSSIITICVSERIELEPTTILLRVWSLVRFKWLWKLHFKISQWWHKQLLTCGKLEAIILFANSKLT